MWNIHTRGHYSALKERKVDPGYNMDEPGGHHAKQNKPVMGR